MAKKYDRERITWSRFVSIHKFLAYIENIPVNILIINEYNKKSILLGSSHSNYTIFNSPRISYNSYNRMRRSYIKNKIFIKSKRYNNIYINFDIKNIDKLPSEMLENYSEQVINSLKECGINSTFYPQVCRKISQFINELLERDIGYRAEAIGLIDKFTREYLRYICVINNVNSLNVMLTFEYICNYSVVAINNNSDYDKYNTNTDKHSVVFYFNNFVVYDIIKYINEECKENATYSDIKNYIKILKNNYLISSPEKGTYLISNDILNKIVELNKQKLINNFIPELYTIQDINCSYAVKQKQFIKDNSSYSLDKNEKISALKQSFFYILLLISNMPLGFKSILIFNAVCDEFLSIQNESVWMQFNYDKLAKQCNCGTTFVRKIVHCMVNSPHRFLTQSDNFYKLDEKLYFLKNLTEKEGEYDITIKYDFSKNFIVEYRIEQSEHRFSFDELWRKYENPICPPCSNEGISSHPQNESCPTIDSSEESEASGMLLLDLGLDLDLFES